MTHQARPNHMHYLAIPAVPQWLLRVTVRLVEERRFDPPRLVEVERDGHWWMGFQFAWRLCDDGHGWLAQVEFSARYDWGWGKHLDCVPPERLRLPAVHGGPFFQ
jgi:hypothetical protein